MESLCNFYYAKDNDGLADIVASRLAQTDLIMGAEKVINAMRKVDRKTFIPAVEDQSGFDLYLKELGIENRFDRFIAWMKDFRNFRDFAYADVAVQIGHGQTCSQPTTMAYTLGLLQLEEKMKILEIGSGCFYSGAVMSELAGPEGFIVSIETVAGLASLASQNANSHFGSNYSNRILIINGDGKLGYPEKAPYDRIIFTAGARDNQVVDDLINVLEGQLKPDGKLLIPQSEGMMRLFARDNGKLRGINVGQANFVPLV